MFLGFSSFYLEFFFGKVPKKSLPPLKADQRSSEEEGEVDSLALEIQHQRLVDGLAAEFETKIDSRSV